MKRINKNLILSLIREEITSQDVDEMAHPRNTEWNTEYLPTHKKFELPDVMKLGKRGTINADQIQTKNPETEEVETGVIYSNTVRISPNEKELVEFKNLVFNKIMFYDPEDNVVFKYIPRSSKYGTAYKQPKIEKDYDQGFINPDKYNERKKAIKTAKVKRYVIFPSITKFFNYPEVKNKLYMCGLPAFKAGSDYTEKITNVEKRMSFNGPYIDFQIHSTRDEKSIQNALDKIAAFREKVETQGGNVEIDDPEFKARKHVRQYAGYIYQNGKWVPNQRTHSEKYHELTDIYRLHKKAVQGGEIAYNITGYFDLNAHVTENDMYMMRMSLNFSRFSRDITASRGTKRGEVIPPITAEISERIPDEIDKEKFDLNDELTRKFFLDVMTNCFRELGRELNQVDPDEALPDFDLEDFEDIEGEE